MKKNLIVLFFLTGVVFSCFAAEVEVLRPERPSQVVRQSMMFKGTVETVMVSDPTRGTKLEVVVVSKDGQTMNFVLTPGLEVATPEGKKIPPKRLKQGDNVTVEYTVTKSDAINRAMRVVVEPPAEENQEEKSGLTQR